MHSLQVERQVDGMAFIRRLFRSSSGPAKSKQVVNGAPASKSTQEATSQMAGLSLNGSGPQDREIATFALS